MFWSVGWPLLRTEGFFYSLDILNGGLGIGKLQFWSKKNLKKFSAVIFFQFLVIKGTVRPDWICMRVVPLESPLKGYHPLYVFDFLISVLNIWNNFKVLSRFMQNWTQPPACSVHGLHRMLSSYWLAHFHLMKNPPKCSSILFWVAVWWNFLPVSRNPKNNWCLSRIYGIRFGEKDHGLSTYKPWTEQAGGLEAFLHGAAQNFDVVLKIQDQK